MLAIVYIVVISTPSPNMSFRKYRPPPGDMIPDRAETSWVEATFGEGPDLQVSRSLNHEETIANGRTHNWGVMGSINAEGG